MGIVMNMSNYAIERGSVEEEYCDGVVCTGRNPDVVPMCQCQTLVVTNKLTISPTDLAMINAGLFVQPTYVRQRTMQSSILTIH